ncbi:MAG TPA: SMI1/KNR4 family protein [Candidatus Dormibacteraeota bacterium]|nr:SMI1/KNR4 family protein [Candidatus Dormibacteraeota bacterium]
MELYEKYLSDRHGAQDADTTWWNLRHRPRLDDSLQPNTGGLALSWRGASKEAIEGLQRSFNLRFPEDYLRFIRSSDGAVGEVGSAWLDIWSVSKVERENGTTERVQARVAFGSGGDGRRYVFGSGPLTNIIEISRKPSHVKEVVRGRSFAEFLSSLVIHPPTDPS